MENSGLIKREYNRSDRRQSIIRLTERAYDLHAAYDAVSVRMNQIFYHGFRDEEIELFEKFLIKILHNLREDEER